MNLLPAHTTGRALLGIAWAALLAALYFHWPQFMVMAGLRDYSAGGGEALVAMIFGLPPLLIAGFVFWICQAKEEWRSRAGGIGAIVSLLIVVAWLVLFVVDS